MDPNTNTSSPSPETSGLPTPTPSFSQPPTKRNKKLFWIVGVVIVLFAIIGVRFVSILAHPPTTGIGAKNSVTTQTKVANVPGQPINCAPSIVQCVPEVDLTQDVIPKLEALGYVCAPDTTSNYDQDCKLPGSAGILQEIVFSNPQGDMTSTHVNSISIDSSTQSPGTSSANLAVPAWQLNGITFGQAVSAVFAKYPQIQKDLKKWIGGQTGVCNYPTIESHDMVDGYQMNCQKASPISVSGNGTSVTTWTSTISITTSTI